MLKKYYSLYLRCEIGDEDQKWAPHIFYLQCKGSLSYSLKCERPSMPFTVLLIWRRPKDHVSNCNFCLNNIKAFTSKNQNKIAYPNLPWAIRPIQNLLKLFTYDIVNDWSEWLCTINPLPINPIGLTRELNDPVRV